MRILIFGDIPGIPQLLRHIPPKYLVGLVGASIRPQHLGEISNIAQTLSLPILIQPKITSPDYCTFVKEVEKLGPDLILVNSYSMILRKDVVDIPRYGGINIHGALLPKYRGCNPTQWAIINSEAFTGVTMHELSNQLDQGAIIDQRIIPISFEDTWQTISELISLAADNLISANIDKILQGAWKSSTQDEAKSNYFRRRTPDDGLFNWNEPIIDIYNKIRALVAPLPGAFYYKNDKRVPMSDQLTLAELTTLKYSETNVINSMTTEQFCLYPLERSGSDWLLESTGQQELSVIQSKKNFFEPWKISDARMHKDIVTFTIQDIALKRDVGACQLCNFNWPHHNAEVQVLIHDESCYDEFFRAQVVSMLCQFGFDNFNLNRISTNVINNQKVISAYQKIGFVVEGVARSAALAEGKWTDFAMMRLLNDKR